MILFIYSAIVGSLMVSYTKARAEGLGIECKVGLLARPERVVLLAIGLLLNIGITAGITIWILALLAVLSNLTAVQRIYVVWRSMQRTQQSRERQLTPVQPVGMDENMKRASDTQTVPLGVETDD
jgi:CDP-diacylglycerol--glycerol-3-phosphate 3-phosphatidyltransferase